MAKQSVHDLFTKFHPWNMIVLTGITAAVCLILLVPIMWSYASGRPQITLAVSHGGTATDNALNVARASDGSTYVSGVFRDEASFGNITVSGHATIPSAFLAKYRTDGTVEWVKTAVTDGVSASGNTGWWVAVDASGNPYLGGTYNGTTSFEGTEVTSNGGGDLFLAKYNPAGTLQWVRVGGSSANEAYGSLFVDTDGTAYVAAGCHSGTAGATFSGTTIHDEVGNAGRDWCVIAYDATGSLVRATMLGGITNQDDEPFGGIVKTSDGFFLAGDICCSVGNTGTMGGVAIEVPADGGGGNDIAVAKFDTNFDLLWFDAVGAAGSETPQGITTVDGDVYVWSNFANNFTAYGEAGAITTAGSNDGVLAKYDGADGTVLWAKTVGGTGSDTVQEVSTDGTHLYIAGAFTPSATVFGTTALTGSGSRHGYAAKLSTDGGVVWALPMSGTGTSSSTRACAYQNGLWCVGILQGTGTFSNSSLTSSAGSLDGFVAAITEISGPTKVPPTRIGTVVLEKDGQTYTVWSPDNDALEDVRVKDAACQRVAYVSGDTNENKRIDAQERWIFACEKTSSRTGTAIVYVRSNGFLISATAAQ